MYVFAALLARQIKLVGALQVHPKLSRCSEILAQSQGRVRRHAALAGDNLIQAVRRNADNIGQPFR